MPLAGAFSANYFLLFFASLRHAIVKRNSFFLNVSGVGVTCIDFEMGEVRVLSLPAFDFAKKSVMQFRRLTSSQFFLPAPGWASYHDPNNPLAGAPAPIVSRGAPHSLGQNLEPLRKKFVGLLWVFPEHICLLLLSLGSPMLPAGSAPISVTIMAARTIFYF